MRAILIVVVVLALGYVGVALEDEFGPIDPDDSGVEGTRTEMSDA